MVWRRLLRKRWVLALVFGLSLVYFLTSTLKQVSGRPPSRVCSGRLGHLSRPPGFPPRWRSCLCSRAARVSGDVGIRVLGLRTGGGTCPFRWFLGTKTLVGLGPSWGGTQGCGPLLCGGYYPAAPACFLPARSRAKGACVSHSCSLPSWEGASLQEQGKRDSRGRGGWASQQPRCEANVWPGLNSGAQWSPRETPQDPRSALSVRNSGGWNFLFTPLVFLLCENSREKTGWFGGKRSPTQ